MTSPLLFYQTVNRMVLPGTDFVFMQICTEAFPILYGGDYLKVSCLVLPGPCSRGVPRG